MYCFMYVCVLNTFKRSVVKVNVVVKSVKQEHKRNAKSSVFVLHVNKALLVDSTITVLSYLVFLTKPF